VDGGLTVMANAGAWRAVPLRGRRGRYRVQLRAWPRRLGAWERRLDRSIRGNMQAFDKQV
jgi:hypothetical protein